MDSIVFLKILRPPAEAIQQIQDLSVATIYEVDNETRIMDPGIKSLIIGQKVCGPALTCQVEPGDNLALHKALTIAEKGDILVVDGSGSLDTAVWGSLMTHAALARGIAGIIVDGSVRDVVEIRALGFPVWAKGTCPKGPTKKKFGSLNFPVRVGGVWVQPGDLILADDDGVAVISAGRTPGLISLGKLRKQNEEEFSKRLLAGVTTIELFSLQGNLDQLNLTEINSDYQTWMAQSKK